MPSLHVLVQLGQELYHLGEEIRDMLTTREQLDWIRTWRQNNGGRFDKPGPHALKALEEMVELCLAAGCQPDEVQATVTEELLGQARKNGESVKTSQQTVAEELADVSICLCVLALGLGVDVSQAVAEKIMGLLSRSWAPDPDGVLRRPSRLQTRTGGRRPVTVCLCGSTRFRDTFLAAQKAETLAGRVVLTVGFFGHMEGLDMNGPAKQALDELHLKKIDMSDEILVLDVGGYIGDSTRGEITHARATGKRVRFWTAEGAGRNDAAGVGEPTPAASSGQ